jgi:thioredoxin-like negative regulator of GroEL
LAVALAEVGQEAEARRVLEQLLEDNEGFKETEAARQLLNALE